MKANLLAGHALPDEGRIRDSAGYRITSGSTACTCGATSPVLTSATKRKAWHRDHKDEIRDGREVANR